MMLSSDPSVEVTLQSIDGLDDFAERKFVVSPSTTVPIGRSSKNHSKKLMSGSDNAFIDSPVISREHARFSASNAMGIPTVYLIDNGSMHGTLVNSKPLQRHQSHRLHNGDTLQFGTNVVRDQDSFIAKKFRFHSQIAPAISHGFTVPDAGDSEEEEVDNDQHPHTSSPRAPTYGSIANPVNLDDFEDIPQEVIDLEDDAVGSGPSSRRASHVDAETAEPPPVVPHIHLPSAPPYSETKTSQDPVEQAPQLPLVGDNESDDEQENIYEVEEEQMHDYEPKSDSLASEDEEEEGEDSEVDLDLDSQDGDNLSNLSQAGSMDNSNLDSENESEDLDNEDAEDADAVPRLKLAQMLNYEHLKSTNDESFAPPTNTLSSPHTIPSAPKPQDMAYSCTVGGFASTVSPQDIHNHPEVTQNNVFHQPFANTAWDPLPPRPTAPKTFWGPPGPDAHGTFLRGELNHFSPYSGSFSGPSYGHRMGYLGQILNSETIPAPYTMTMGLPTPPVPTPGEVRPLTPPANRRNGVSIPELVEETPQQPPTPTSVDSPKNLKRKAEFLEEEEEEIEVATNEVYRDVQAVVPEAAPVKAEEPQAKRRRITLTAVATNAASFIAGTVFAVGALVLLPEITFS